MFFSYLTIIMQTLASLTRTTKNGLVSTWHFVQAPDAFYAFGGCREADAKRFDTIEELRSLYTSYLGYGYTRMVAPVQLELALA